MAREIAEQPEVIRRLLDRFDDNVARVAGVLPEALAGTVLVARGSSDNAAVFGRYLIEQTSGRPTGLGAPSLFTRYHQPTDYRGHLAVALSQSGVTPEIVEVCRQMGRAGARTVAITNDGASALAQVADVVLELGAGPEVAVPATKTVMAEFVALLAVAGAFGALPFPRSSLDSIADAVRLMVEDPAPASGLAASWTDVDHVLVTARGSLHAVALEAALKIKEAAQMPAEAISGADLRHGPLAAVHRHDRVLVLDGGGPLSADVGDLTTRLADLGADVATCSERESADLPLPPGLIDPLSAFPALVRVQQLALALAHTRGFDPDLPPGLTKVTPTR
jgi:glucosamine--fructose-6-phosphate aminotransferase (isomerizing)